MLSSNRTRRISSGEVSSDHQLSAAVIAANADLLLEILLCLPVRSLLVFKSVSKRWLSLISDPYFVDNHILRIRSHPIPRLFLRKVTNPEFEFIFLDGNVIGVPFKSLDFVNDPGGIMVQQSCNGLLCCSDFRPDDYNRSNCTYYVYNPSTKHYTTLPRSPNRETVGVHAFTDSESPQDCPVSVCSISLAFDPLKSPHYKAICVLHNESDAFRACDDLFLKSRVYWNGSLHWMSYIQDSLCFDVDRELIKPMPVPPAPDGSTCGLISYFGESKGHMHLIMIYNLPTTKFDICEMETDYSRWKMKYHVDLDAVTVAYAEIIQDYCEVTDLSYFKYFVLLVVEEEVLSSLVLQIPYKIISFNLKDITCKEILVLAADLDSEDSHYRCEAHQYIETLACV